MQNDMMKQWAELNKVAMSAIQELGAINTNAMTRLTQRQMEVVSLYVEGGAKQLEVIGQTNNVQDAVAAQSKLFAELNEKLMDNARKTIEVLTDTKAELATWAEKSMSVAVKNATNRKDDSK